MRKTNRCLLSASLSMVLLSAQVLQAQTNTATGVEALQNTTGTNNTATGYRALQLNTTGNANTATGAAALHLNTTRSNNTASGFSVLAFNTARGSVHYLQTPPEATMQPMAIMPYVLIPPAHPTLHLVRMLCAII